MAALATMVGDDTYGDFEAEARKRLGTRDPRDWSIFLALGCPIWTEEPISSDAASPPGHRAASTSFLRSSSRCELVQSCCPVLFLQACNRRVTLADGSGSIVAPGRSNLAAPIIFRVSSGFDAAASLTRCTSGANDDYSNNRGEYGEPGMQSIGHCNTGSGVFGTFFRAEANHDRGRFDPRWRCTSNARALRRS